MNDIHHKLMCYSGEICGSPGHKEVDNYYICVPNTEDVMKTIYLRKDSSVGFTTKETGAPEDTYGWWTTYADAKEALAQFQKQYKHKRIEMKRKLIKAKQRKRKKYSPLVLAGLFKAKDK